MFNRWPLEVIDSLKVTDANYETTWKLIKEHYAIKQAIMKSFKKFSYLLVITKYMLFLNTIQRDINCLKDLLPNIDDNAIKFRSIHKNRSLVTCMRYISSLCF